LLIWSLLSLLYCSIICLVSSTSILFTILKTEMINKNKGVICVHNIANWKETMVLLSYW
jgi:hypothetical protein